MNSDYFLQPLVVFCEEMYALVVKKKPKPWSLKHPFKGFHCSIKQAAVTHKKGNLGQFPSMEIFKILLMMLLMKIYP